MPRSFSGFQSRPQPQLFVVPREPEKTVKEKELPAGDLFEDTNGMEIEELRAWVEDIIQTEVPEEDGPVTTTSTAPANKTPGSPLLKGKEPTVDWRFTGAFQQAMAWGRPQPMDGVRPSAILSGPGAQVETGVVPQGYGLQRPHLGLAEPADTVLIVRTDDAMVMSLQSDKAFGYTGAELIGQPLLAITHPSERADLLHSLQVLTKMEEISRAINPAGGGQNNAIRLVHHVLVGLGRSTPPELMAIETTARPVPEAGGAKLPSTVVLTSRKADGVNAQRPFCMLPM